MATLKRELQLLIYGVNVFLDVDDLKEIGQLDTCEMMAFEPMGVRHPPIQIIS